MSLGVILKNFGEQMKAHLDDVESAIQAKVDAAEKAVHDKWDAMGAELKDLEAKVTAKQAELAAVEAELAAVMGLKTAGEAAKVAEAAVPAPTPDSIIIINDGAKTPPVSNALQAKALHAAPAAPAPTSGIIDSN